MQLQGKPAFVDEEPHHDLGFESAFLGQARLTVFVFPLDLEEQCSDVVQHECEVFSPSEGDAGGSELVSIIMVCCLVQ